MTVELRPLTDADVAAHCAGEDQSTVRWLTKQPGTHESTRRHFERLARNAADGRGKRGFGIWSDGRLAGYVDCDPDVTDGVQPGDVNVTYAVHPWARGRGVAGEAVGLMCAFLAEQRIGRRAVVRVEPDNLSSVRVAEKVGFRYLRDFISTTDVDEDGDAIGLSLYARSLVP